MVMLASTIAQAVAGEALEAREWITRMNATLATQSYDGVFNYTVLGRHLTLRIIHRKQNGKMAERLIFFDSKGREIVRNGKEVIAYFPELKMARVETRNRSWGFIAALNGLNQETERYYEISTAGTESLVGLGRTAQLISFEPRDTLRYGYRFWLDSQTAMPLRTQMVSRAGEVMEEISFVNLEMRNNIPDELLKSAVDTTDFRWMTVPDAAASPSGLKASFVPRTSLMPAGFRVTASGSGDKGPRTRFIVSDGVAWVSVFVDKWDRSQPLPRPAPGARPDGVLLFGLSATYVAYQDGYKVTVIGEVPPLTVRSIAEAVQPE